METRETQILASLLRLDVGLGMVTLRNPFTHSVVEGFLYLRRD